MKNKAPLSDIFSPTQTKIIKIIGGRKITTREIAERLYKGEPKLSPLTTVSSMVNRIAAKCEFYKLDWTLTGEGMGRNGKLIWKDDR